MRRLQLVAAAAFIVTLAAPAAAQTGRIQGVVRDVGGEPIKGATIRAVHPDAIPREFTSATDERGRWAIIGMRIGPNWRFIAEAPGYFPEEGTAQVRSTLGQPLVFTLRKDPGPIPGALAKDIMGQLTVANSLRDQGRYDEAIAAYQSIQTQNAKLTTVSLVLGNVYRDKAERESGAARRTSLEKAAAAYQAVLKDDAENERAKQELAAVTAALTQTR
jgi:hypothetical protein